MGMGGAGVMAVGKMYQGAQQRKADYATAGQLEEEAGQSVASGIQGQDQALRKGEYVASQARARMAAGGLTTTSGSNVNTLGLIQGQSTYNAATAIYQGEDRAQELDNRAGTLQSEGNAAALSGFIGGMSTAVGGGMSFNSKYGG